jgi:hypothetical protein
MAISNPHPSIEEGFEMLAAGRTAAVGRFRIAVGRFRIYKLK